MKTLAAAILLALSAHAMAGPLSDSAIKDYKFAAQELVHNISRNYVEPDKCRPGHKICDSYGTNLDAFVQKRSLTTQYLDYCQAWRVVVAAFKMERDSANYEAWMMAETPFVHSTYIGEAYAQYYCK